MEYNYKHGLRKQDTGERDVVLGEGKARQKGQILG
jgi:hypothetical protein